MKSDRRKKRSTSNEQESTGRTIISMLFSLFLVGLSLLFVIGFRYFLKGRTYEGSSSTENTVAKDGDILDLDKSYNIEYIMIKNLSEGEEFAKTAEPGVMTDESERLSNGQILEVKEKGSYKDKDYYRLKDNTYIEADENKVIELSKFVPLTGYIEITYINSSGVKEHKWLDFDADNVAKSAYVKDKVEVNALVTAIDGTSAFRTVEGYYITTDSRYFTDCTKLADKTSMDTSDVTTESDEDDTEATTEERTQATTEESSEATTEADIVTSTIDENSQADTASTEEATTDTTSSQATEDTSHSTKTDPFGSQ